MKKRQVSILSVVAVPAVVLPIVVAGPAQAAAKPASVAPAVAPAPKPRLNAAELARAAAARKK